LKAHLKPVGDPTGGETVYCQQYILSVLQSCFKQRDNPGYMNNVFMLKCYFLQISFALSEPSFDCINYDYPVRTSYSVNRCGRAFQDLN